MTDEVKAPICPIHGTALGADGRGYGWWCAECRETEMHVADPPPPTMPVPPTTKKGRVIGRICADRHERITYQEEYCPLCRVLQWTEAVAAHATETFTELERLRDERVYIKNEMFAAREHAIVVATAVDLAFLNPLEE
jgi:hypothetical protein